MTVQVYIRNTAKRHEFIDMSRKCYFSYEFIYSESDIVGDAILVTDSLLAGSVPARIVIPFEEKENIYKYVDSYGVVSDEHHSDIKLENLLQPEIIEVSDPLSELDVFVDELVAKEEEQAKQQALKEEEERIRREECEKEELAERVKFEKAQAIKEKEWLEEQAVQRTLSELATQTDDSTDLVEDDFVEEIESKKNTEEDFIVPAVIYKSDVGIKVRRHRTSTKIHAFYGAKSLVGVSSLVYSLASQYASEFGLRVLVIDMDIAKSGMSHYLSQCNHWSMSDETGLSMLFRVDYSSFITSVDLFTKQCNSSGNIFRFMRGPGEIRVKNKLLMSNFDYTPVLSEFEKLYDVILLDMGVWNPQFEYQMDILNCGFISSVCVIANSNAGEFSKGMGFIADMPKLYSVVINRASRASNMYTLQAILDRPVLGMIYNLRSLKDSLMSGKAFQDVCRGSEFDEMWENLYEGVKLI